MKLKSLKRRLDILFATLVALAFGSVAVVAYGRISQNEAPQSALIGSIPSGAHRYALLTENGCVGTISTDLVFKDDQYSHTTKGEVRLVIGEKTFNPAIDSFANFNSIGQLGGSVFNIRESGVFIRIGSVDLNPITVRIRYNIPSIDPKPFIYETLVPGPVYLKENLDHSFRVEYLHFGKVLSNYSDLLQHPLLKSFSIRAVEVTEGNESCADKPKTSINLNPLLPFLLGFSRS